MKNSNYQIYVSGTIKLGVSFGIVSLLARWITGNSILSSPEMLMKYGLTGGIGYSLMGAVGLILFGFLAKKIRERYPNQSTIGDVLHGKLTPIGYGYMMTVILFTSFDSMFVQAISAGILLHMISPLPIFVGMFIFLLFCYIVGGIGGMQRIHQLAGLNVSLAFGAVIVIPVYFYIQQGISPVYDGIKLYHPYLLYLKNTDATFFIFTAILIGFGQIIIDRSTWQRIFIIKKEKIQLTFMLAGLIWLTIPLAISSLLLIIIYGRSYDNIYSLLYELINKIGSTPLIILFVLFCFSALSSALSSELNATTSLIVKNIFGVFRSLSNQGKWKYTSIISGLICLVLLGLVSFLKPNLLALLFFFGNIYASLIAPMIVIVLSKKMVTAIVPFASLVGLVGGYISLYIIGLDHLMSIWVSFTISSTICILYSLYNTVFFKNDFIEGS
ncbi:hypothetical protein RRV45_04325 [Bacillus sp. DTU_2020_1000418_1_SI_GHA_SEK_038]|uniref:hypothetical protein n=1 Tax=Bacillus sp. DTU_2020_1000418_1_SI_GHA_SEK_038 TaxID=3077585 RepID=UPI0028E7827F|nr:hypothetical protein [Bacillus sp. DTU_2020_1000418_1_SI_GHA_SEK_038]WNS76240.1 hypothetical protein RRV45_04325 [Bacillus sp. DTU_2020_1000418_1_SI_GHA_SEK_038]